LNVTSQYSLNTFYHLPTGVSLAIKTMHSNVEVIGVEPENVASYAAAIKAGRPVNGFKEATLADGLAVPVVGDHHHPQLLYRCPFSTLLMIHS
jgi:threonine dehydratase